MSASRHLLALACVAAALGADATAHANGRYPAAQHVLAGPGSSTETIVLRNTFGFLVSRDSGASFGWVCEDALGYGGEFDPPFALDAAGRVHVGTYAGLQRLGADGCSVDEVEGFAGLNVVDLDNHPSGATVFALVVTPFVSDGPPVEARVFRSQDGGDSYQLLSSTQGLLLETLEHAPSLVSRVYLSGATAPPSRPIALRSDDGGATLTELAFAWPSDVERLFVAGVHPEDEDVFYLRAALKPSSGKSTAIFRTTDGGSTFDELLRTDGPALGFALAADGTVWVGSPADGLLRSMDGGDSFSKIQEGGVRCLRHHQGALFVCAGPPDDTPMLGRSTDGGLSVDGLVSSCTLEGTSACPSRIGPVASCTEGWPQVASVLPCIEAPGTGGAAGGPPTVSGGGGAPSGATGGESSGTPAEPAPGGCATAPRSVDPSVLGLVALVLWGASRATRRRRLDSLFDCSRNHQI